MSEYTPDESIVREFYVEAAYALGTDPSEGVREFDRFIAHIKADAWDEGQSALLGYEQDRSHPLTSKPVPVPVNPYRGAGGVPGGGPCGPHGGDRRRR